MKRMLLLLTLLGALAASAFESTSCTNGFSVPPPLNSTMNGPPFQAAVISMTASTMPLATASDAPA